MRLLVILGVLGSAAHAFADNVQQADALFDEGQKLRKAGDKAGACDKFSGALKLNPNAVGAILNVALCKEEANKFASAVRLFTSARDLAREHNLEPERKAAEEHLTADEPRVAHLAIAFTETPSPDTKIVVDDEVVPVDQATDVPVDPGERTIVISQPGRVSYETKIKLAEKDHKAIAVPRLARPVVVKRTRITYGKVLTFSGIGLIVTSEAVAYYAYRMYRREIDSGHCTNTNPPACEPTDGYRNTQNAHTYGNVGTGLGIVGVAALGVGAYLWFFAPKETTETPPVAITPVVSPDLNGFVATGRF